VENRRSDDPRIDDIQRSVHELDRRLLVVETRQEAFEDSMEEAHSHLHSKIDAVRSDLRDGIGLVHKDVQAGRDDFAAHVKQETEDRRVLMRTLVSLIITVVLALAAWALTTLTDLKGVAP
jgi:septal ring factor EnvC (AmiA/AmiB activator)